MQKYTGLIIITAFLLLDFFITGLGLYIEYEGVDSYYGLGMIQWSIIIFILIIVNHIWPRKKPGSKQD